MRNIDFTKCWEYGVFRASKLYHVAFNKLHNTYNYYNEDLKMDTSFLTLEKCKELFGENIDVVLDIPEKIYSTSKADSHPLPSSSYNMDGIFKDKIYPSIMIVNYTNEWIATINDNAIYLHFNNLDHKELVKKILDTIPLQPAKPKTATIDLIAYDRGNYYTINSKIKHTTVDLELNYNNGFSEVYEKTLDFLNEQESGLVILHGGKGTGKTQCIRHLLSHTDKHYILVTNAIASHMAEPEFIAFMMEHKDSIFILEDCEQILMAREENRFGGAIANILNMSDGLMSDIFNIKFICTFNTSIENIDEALLRPGRCFINYEFKPLDKAKVKVLSEKHNLGITEDRDMTLAEIFNYVPEVSSKLKKTKIGF
jgi:hypothetical protein